MVVFCGLLMTVSAISVDIMFPAFFQMRDDLRTDLAAIQLTVPVFLIASGVAQLFYGAFSDKFGRKAALYLGLSAFLLGTLIVLMADNATVLLAGRAVQGFGAASGPVMGRAIIRDTHSGQALAQAMAGGMAIFSIGPIIAPLIGYGFILVGDWRLIFWFLAAMGALMLAVSRFLLQETNTNRDPSALKLSSLRRAFTAIAVNSQSRNFLMLATLAYMSIFVFLTHAPRIYVEELGTNELWLSIYFGITGIGIILGQIANRYFLRRLHILTVMRVASSVLLISSLSMLIAGLNSALSAFGFTALMFLFNTSFLVVIANSLTLISDPHPKIAGQVSSLFGFTTTIVAAAIAAATIQPIDGDIIRWSVTMSIITGLVLLILVAIRRRSIELRDG